MMRDIQRSFLFNWYLRYLRYILRSHVILPFIFFVSVLYLLLHVSPTPQTPVLHSKLSHNFVIHMWRHHHIMKSRFLTSFGNQERDPFDSCSVNNCLISTDDSRVNESDAVLFDLIYHLAETSSPDTLPTQHPPAQVWVFFTDECPLRGYLPHWKSSMKDYDGLFNWSMTYRSFSEVPVPYGRTIELSQEELDTYRHKDYARTKSQGVVIVGSNCDEVFTHRWKCVHELQKYLPVDVYGDCGNHSCLGRYKTVCNVISNYKFYLAFENSNCDEYITEKLWWNAYHEEVVPVVMGAPRSEYEKLCPPNSFIHVSDFKSPAYLAEYLSSLMTDDDAYNAFFHWKRYYKVLNEHGYSGAPSLHLCRLCEALNRGLPRKTYKDLTSYWNPKRDCHLP